MRNERRTWRRLRFAGLAAGLGLAVAATGAMAGRWPEGTYRTVTVTAIGGTDPITLPVRRDGRGDDEVYVPDRGWVRCELRSCAYTVRKWHFHFWEEGTGRGIGRGILLDVLGID